MKPSLAVATNIQIDRLNADQPLATIQVTYRSNESRSEALSHPFRVIVILILCAGSAMAQTTIVAVRDSNSLVLAADSKLSVGDAPFCKIRRCGNGYLAVSGAIEALGLPKLWPQLLEACTGRQDPKERVAMLEKTSVAWLNAAIEDARKVNAKRRVTETDLAGYRKNAIVSFVLVGWKDTSGFIYGRGIGNFGTGLDDLQALVSDRKDMDAPSVTPQDSRIFLGHFEGIQRFLDTPEPFESLGLVKGAEFLVNSMIVERATMYRDVGRPVDILLIDKNGAHWIQRKPECEEEKAQPKKPAPKPTSRKPKRG